MRVAIAALAILAAAVPAAEARDSPVAGGEHREACDSHDPLRRPFFGDTHVHTALSFDAMGQGTRGRPRDAYRFARGEPIGLPPYDALGAPGRNMQLRTPLDFAVVTDHSEMLGETSLCTNPSSATYDAFPCVVMRRWPRLGYVLINGHVFRQETPVRLSMCGEDGALCREGASGPWQEIRAAAEEAYDRTSACRFSSFVGYEWSGMPLGENIHRNVVFRNERVPRLPINYIDTPTPEALRRGLESQCLERGDGCDVITIPHNSNVGNGRMWAPPQPPDPPLSTAGAARRARLEPLVEVTQHKGDSECRAGQADELCAFETLSWARMEDASQPWAQGDLPAGLYAREALSQGLLHERELAVNPFKFGLIGSTDTHYATPGMVDEDRHPGHGAGSVSSRLEVPPLPDQVHFNPGGLAVLWAEENSRDALFAAMRRREAYGTSGPRLEVRFFGGWELPEDLCTEDDLASRGYAAGVPMGGDLVGPSASTQAPRFAISALRAPDLEGFPGTPLQRIQIVKGWVEADVSRERVHEVAGDARNGAGVDLATCTPHGGGFDRLCTVWTDPDFDPAAPAYYYARVVENPTCRWQRHVCLARGVDCNGSEAPRGPLAACCDGSVPDTIQERAWTSPIWYTPETP